MLGADGNRAIGRVIQVISRARPTTTRFPPPAGAGIGAPRELVPRRRSYHGRTLPLDLQKRLGVTYPFIAHDLAAVAHMSHAIAVMDLGKIVEWGDAEAGALAPKHPDTKALFAAALPIDIDVPREEVPLPGELPSPLAPPAGCRFHPRCPVAMPHCATQEPAPRAEAGRLVACHLYRSGPSMRPLAMTLIT
jgi:oligopeptide/dipeptide ABC transporter ATP-binding protein